MHMALDRESSNMTAVPWLFAERVTVEVTWDPAHRAWNDIKRPASDTGNYAWLLSLLLLWNIPHGPWSEAARSSQCREAIVEMCGKEWSEVAPLFGARVFEMLREGNMCGLLADESIVQDMWQRFRSSNPFVNKHTKVSLNRFMSLVKTGRAEKPLWAMRKVVYEYVCLELDLLGGKGVEQVILQQRSAQDDQSNEEGGASSTTAQTKLDIVKAALRRNGKANASACGVRTLSEPLGWRRLCIFIEFRDHIDKWHQRQSTSTRSCTASRQCLMGELNSDGTMRHISLLWLGVISRAALGRQGFWMPNIDNPVASETVLVVDEVLAAEAGNWCMSLLFRRLHSCLPVVYGWSSCSLRFLADPNTSAIDIARLRNHYENFQRLEEASSLHARMRDLVARSLFQRECVLQLVGGCVVEGWQLTSQLRDWFLQRAAHNGGAQVNEDGFNLMKNERMLRNNKIERRAIRSLAYVLHRRVLDKVHKYRALRPTQTTQQRGLHLTSSTFQPTSKPGMEFKRMVGCNTTPYWWSPSADKAVVPTADLFMLQWVVDNDALEHLGKAWLGSVARWSHRLLLRRSGSDDGWCFALGPVADSAVLTWEAHRREVDGVTFYEPVIPVTRPNFVVIVDFAS